MDFGFLPFCSPHLLLKANCKYGNLSWKTCGCSRQNILALSSELEPCKILWIFFYKFLFFWVSVFILRVQIRYWIFFQWYSLYGLEKYFETKLLGVTQVPEPQWQTAAVWSALSRFGANFYLLPLLIAAHYLIKHVKSY